MRSFSERNNTDDERREQGQTSGNDGIRMFGVKEKADTQSADVKSEHAGDASWKTKTDKEKVVFEGLSWLKSICIGVLIGVLLVVFVCQRNNIYGPSMLPTLEDGDMVYVQKISNYLKNYDRGDIVVLDGSNMEGYNHEEYLIKRIVGLPGETVKFSEGNVYIKKAGESNFTLLEEPYLAPGTITTVQGSGLAKGYDEITLSSDEYFCLGDNRLVSNDSRALGPFTQNRIKGVVLIRVYPFSKFGTVD